MRGGVAPTLPSGTNEGMNIQPIIAEDSLDEYAIRRLTPTECERLQGFPDNWTLIPWKGKPAEECPDGPRYKCIGNSMATNVMRLIGERLEEVDSLGE